MQVFAVLMGSRVPNLSTRLAGALDKAELIDFDCLLPGALDEEAQARAPYLVQLKANSAFSDWLLFEAAAGLGDWGLIVLSVAKLLPLRAHLRSLLQAQAHDGTRFALDWMDPVILQALLPLFETTELIKFLGPLHTLVIPAATQWSWFSQLPTQPGQLLARTVTLMQPN
ncbi:DUF4123 domain-containing protein [Roseateles sp. GG27B]